MAVAEELQVIIDAKVQDAVRDMKKVDKSLGNVEKSTKKLSPAVSKTLKSLGGFAAAAVSIGAITKTIKESVAAFKEQEQASRALQAAVERNPLLDPGAAGRIEKFAAELQNVSTVGDETAIRLASVAASSGRTEEEITNMVTAAADVSAAMGITMDAAIRSLNKSFGGLTGELGELIPELGDLTEEELKAGGAVDLVREQFDGAAAAIADTASGSLQQAKNAFGDLREQMGRNFLNSSGPIITAFKAMAEAATESLKSVNDFNEVIQDLAAGEQVNELDKLQNALDEAVAKRRQLIEEGGIRAQLTDGEGLREVERLDNLIAEIAGEMSRLESQDYWSRFAGGADEAADSTERLSKGQRDFIEVNSGLQAELARIRENSEALGSSYDAQAKRADAVRSAIEELVSRGYQAENANIQTLLENYGHLMSTEEDVAESVRTVGRAYDTLTSSALRANAAMFDGVGEKTEEVTKSIIDISQQQMERLTTLASQTQATLSQLGSFLSAQTAAQVSQYQNAQEEQMAALEARLESGEISQEEYAAARERLEERTQRKIAKEQEKQARQQKALAIIQSIINTAVGVTKALAQTASPVLAGIIGAAGAAQTALIAAQPIPEFATGGSFETTGPQVIQVGDNPGGRERVTVEPTSSSIGSGEPMHITVSIDGKPIIDTVQRASRSRNLLIDARAVV